MNPDLNSIARALDRLVTAHQRGAWDYIAILAVGCTLLVLIRYTVETYKLRRAAQEQTAVTGNLLNEAQRQNETSLHLVEQAQRQNEVTANLLREAQRQNEATANLVTEAQRQNEVALMPILAILVVLPERITSSEAAHGDTRPKLELRNVGAGPAFNVSIDKYVLENRELVSCI